MKRAELDGYGCFPQRRDRCDHCCSSVKSLTYTGGEGLERIDEESCVRHDVSASRCSAVFECCLVLCCVGLCLSISVLDQFPVDT